MIEAIRNYHPYNAQEATDRIIMLELMQRYDDIYERENRTVHMTASAWVVDPSRTKVLMAYHRIYDSWAWLGGHADGCRDLMSVAVREVREESGLKHVRVVDPEIYSLEILTVDGHEKNGQYVPSHLHLNLTWLMEADPAETITAKEDENTAVAWFGLEEVYQRSTEPWFIERIYKKLNEKLKTIPE